MKTSVMLAVVFTLLTQVSTATEEINKWVDENGTVHFSDRAPQDKTVAVEKMENKQAPKLGLSDAELSEKKRRVSEYQNQVRARQYENRNAALPGQQDHSDTLENTEISPEQAKILCRNAYPNNTKLRTECFKQIQQAAK